jgi:hypothetical protein
MQLCDSRASIPPTRNTRSTGTFLKSLNPSLYNNEYEKDYRDNKTTTQVEAEEIEEVPKRKTRTSTKAAIPPSNNEYLLFN